MQAGYVCCFVAPNRAWNRSSPRQLGASVIAAAHIAQFQYIVKCVVGASSDMWAVTKTHRGSAMTLDQKIDETATHVAPYVLSIAHVVIALMFMEPGTSKPFGFPAPTATPDPFTLLWFAAIIEIVGGAQLRSARMSASGAKSSVTPGSMLT